MIFRTQETDDGNFELILDDEGIDYLTDGLTELSRMNPDESLTTPSITESGVGEFVLRRAGSAL